MKIGALFLFALMFLASVSGTAHAKSADGGADRHLLQAYGRRLQSEGSERELLQAYGRRLSDSEGGAMHRVRRLFGN